MKNYVTIVVLATLNTLLCLNVAYSTPSDNPISDNLYEVITESSNHISANALTNNCASTCGAASSGNDCGSAIYEGQGEYPGNAFNSTTSGNGDGIGCQYFGFSSALELGANTGTSFTYCTEYTANSEEASYIPYLSAASSSCLNHSVQIYNANTCGIASVGLQQPVGNSPAKAIDLRRGDSYTVCYTYTENGCSSDFQSSIFEFCSSILELPYCSSAATPQSTIEVCSGESFEIDLGNACNADSDLTTGFNNGLSGFAAFYYEFGNRYTNFPEYMTAGDIGGSAFVRYFGESNLSNGGGCTSIEMNSIINTSCEPLEIVVGIVPVDVNSVDGAIINLLSDCRITEVTVLVYPQLTSQITNNNIQLLTEDGTVCETYSTNSGGGNNGSGTLTPSSISAGVISIGNFTLIVNNDYNVATLGSSPTKPTGSDSNTGTDAPCVTPSSANNLIYNSNGEMLIDHTIEVNDDGQLVLNYELPVNKAKLYPNPATNQLFFTTGIADAYTVRIYDTLGKQVFAGQTNDGIAVDIQRLSSGLYTYVLEDNQQNVFDHGKWVKQ